MKDLVIFGSGGFAREVLQIVQDANEDGRTWNFMGFLDDNSSIHGHELHDYPILGGVEWLGRRESTWLVVALGRPDLRRRVVQRVVEAGTTSFATVVHPESWIGRRVRIGAGSMICAGNRLTTDIEIGRHVIVNLQCTIGHDTRIEDYVTSHPAVNISGSVHLEEGVELGTGGAIIQGIRVGRWSILGAGAVVAKDIPPNVTAVGVPAKVVKERPDGWHETDERTVKAG
jgi:sugar O-acyltransferase (sialic acid O-acetyltransferase NeuD family)